MMDDRSSSRENSVAAGRQDDAATASRSEKRPDFTEQRSLPCENMPHPIYAEWTGEECDHESFFCFSEGVNNNCCKCRPECCGQCNTLATFNDPYQACPVLSAKAHAERSIDEISTTNKILIAASVACILGILLTGILALWNCWQERTRMSLLVKDDKTKNLREYRDEADVDDGVFRDKPYR